MSTEVREKLAAAANAVPGITCTPWFRQTTKAGDAMVRLDRIEYPNVFGGLRTWQLVLVLPQDLAAAEKYIEDKTPALYEALSAEMVIRRISPQQLALDTGTIPVLFIEGQRED